MITTKTIYQYNQTDGDEDMKINTESFEWNTYLEPHPNQMLIGKFKLNKDITETNTYSMPADLPSLGV